MGQSDAPPTASTFAERLAYARWVRQLTTASPEESDKDLAGRVGVTPPWLAKWKGRENAPPGHKELVGLARALQVPDDWLVADGEASAPLPALWRDWLAARRGHPVALDAPRYVADEVMSLDQVGLLLQHEANALIKTRRASARGTGDTAAGGARGGGRHP